MVRKGAKGPPPAANRVIGPAELLSEDTPGLARWLLGKVLVRSGAGPVISSVITEVEAYDTELDLACHARSGRTARTDVLYAQGGVWYVYLIYGMHRMLNLVTGPEGRPAAVLIRGTARVSGPGRLTREFGIGMDLNRAAAHPDSGLHVEDQGLVVAPRQIRATPRIGVDYAGPVWSAKPWRFILDPSVVAETVASERR